MSIPEDPERLAEAAPRSPLGELFASASRDLPADEQLARLAANLGPILNDAPGTPPTTSGTSLVVKLGVVTGALALLIGAGLSLSRSPQPAAVPATVTPKVALTPKLGAPAPVVDAPPAATATVPSSASAAESASSAPTSKPSSAQGKALSEAALLEQARRALNTSPSYALQLANQHRTRFPHGVLSQEREVIAIEALRRLHRASEADQRATGFSKSFPGSAHQRMVDEAAPK